MNKLISIIVPIYNGEKYIEKTLNKLLEIKVNKEIIVINDCSSDNSLNILMKYDGIVKIINFKKNAGVSHARNVGIKESNGEYVSFVDIDDDFNPCIFKKMITKMDKEKSDVCVCNYDEYFENSGEIVNSKYCYKNNCLNQEDSIKSYLIDKISPAVWDKIYKKELIKFIFFNEGLAIGEDICFCLNVFMKAKKVSFVNESLYHYLQQDYSVMHTISPKLLHFRNVVSSIPHKDRIVLEKKYCEEFNYFYLEMYTRAIHSISNISNENNKKQSIQYLNEYYDIKILKKIIKCKYFSKSVRLEMLILMIFGIRFHLMLTPIYKKIRNRIR